MSENYCIVWNQSATVKNFEISLIHWKSKPVVAYITSLRSTSRILGQIMLFDKKKNENP